MNIPEMPISKKIFLAAAMISALAGSIQTVIELNKLIPARKANPFFFGGTKVAGLQMLLKNERAVGYYTDININNDSKAVAQFSQFQLELAPAILDNENFDHRFLIIDCKDPAQALKKIQELKAKALSRNNFGTIIALREGF